jgi:alkylation response protein AidB-like acyl-CoA dehydrogenase
MDFRLSEDQDALKKSVRSFAQARFSVERLRALEKEPRIDRALWAELAGMGVFNLRSAEVGLGMQDAVLVFEELGRQVAPGPLIWTHLAADLVQGASEGRAIVGGLDLGGRRAGPLLIEHAESLDALLILEPNGIRRIEPKSIALEPIAHPLDPLTPVSRARSLPKGEQVAGADRSMKMRLEGATLSAAMMLGISETTEELAVEYAKARQQFGKPIGSFQAIKHIAADMFVRQELARAAVYAAGATVDDPSVGDSERSVRAAKLIAGEAAMKNARACIQIHGGMGYTWEIAAHYYLKRTLVLESQFGTIEEHAERIARLSS